MTHVFARNDNLERYLRNYVENNNLRWTYIRSAQRLKIGCLISFVDTDLMGRRDLYVGLSKCALSKGDSFSLDIGLAKAIDHAVPFAKFLDLYEKDQLPRIPLTFRCVRDEQGYVVENEYEIYNQYEAFVEKLKRVYNQLDFTNKAFSFTERT